MKQRLLIAAFSILLCIPAFAANDSENKKEVKYNEKGEIIKTGTNFGPLPVVAFDADRGFQFGALLNLYNFGDGSTYPNPKSTWYFEASAYTKDSSIGSYKLIVNYDNKTLIPGVRMSICTGYYKDAALDFYGFNGYHSNYIPMAELNEEGYFKYLDNEAGKKLMEKGKTPKGFYRFSRDLIKAKADFTGKIFDNLYWEAGYNFSWVKAGSFTPSGYEVFAGNDFTKGTTLFDLYKEWGIIPENQAEGGLTSAIRAGLMYDSRNIENNPTKGIWAEAHVIAAPKWLGTTDPHYKFCATMRQYIPLVPEKLTFAYRLAYQGTFGSNAPWYAMPFYTNMGPKADNDGFGGYRTVRGLMLNRVQGQDVGFYNIELRWRFIDFKLFNQNIAFALSGFTDAAHVFKGYDLENRTGKYMDLYNKFIDINRKADGFHGTAGAGLRFIMNQNFIVAFEYARCFNKQDGNGAFYINTGFLF
ncbi:MAG: hypothetical protein E7112_03740 [Bacteroidales bacterium]|nr:hypothetical protein [Bacteroidales bacterium]